MRGRLARSIATGAVMVTALGIGAPGAAPAASAQPSKPVVAAAGRPSYETWIADVTVVTTQLVSYLNDRLAAAGAAGERPAIVLDIDNTSLETAYHFGFPIPAIPPVLSAVKLAKDQGAAVFFVTNRPELLRLATEANLRQVGYPVDGLRLRPWLNSESTEKVKTDARAAIERAGYVIVANVGNNTWDLAGGHAERTFKLPDYDGALD